jgi:hypothetical protein
MKRISAGVAMLFLFFWASAGTARAQHGPVRIYLAPSSMVYQADIVRHLGNKCPNVTLTLDSKKSDYMLDARGWSGHYKFTLFRHGGDAVFSTQTQMMSNSVKDVCRFINSQSNPPTNAPGSEAKPSTK